MTLSKVKGHSADTKLGQGSHCCIIEGPCSQYKDIWLNSVNFENREKSKGGFW